MEFGSFRTLVCIAALWLGNTTVQAQQRTKTSEFLYNQLDYFAQKPSNSGALRLSKMIASKKNQLHTKADQLAWVIVNCNLGYYHNQFNHKPTAILYYETAWKTYYEKELTDYDIIENCLQPLGNIYIEIGDLPKAETTIKNYLYLAEQSENTSKIISGITNLSIAYHNQGNYPKALKILKQGLDIDPDNTNLLTNTATNYLDSGNYDKAKKIANKVIAIDANQINAYQILAATALERKEFQNAQDYILQARSQLLKNKNTSARTTIKWQLAYIDILLSKSEFGEVQKNLKEIYTSLLPGYSANTDLPSKEHLIADRLLLKALDIHVYIYQETKNPLLAIAAFDLAFDVNSKLNILYPLQDTRIIQHGQNRNRTETYIDLLFTIYKDKKDKKYGIQAFQAAERSKAPFVNEALISKKLLSQYKNDSLVSNKNRLNSKLVSYETLILKEKLKGEGANIAQIQKWTTAHDTTSIALKGMLKKLHYAYPKLLRYQNNISIPTLQKKLKKDHTTLIEYFYGNRNIYQFVITQDSFEIKKIENPEYFKSIIKKYVHYFDNASIITRDITKFTKKAAELFNVLKIPRQSKRLLIIPDGLLYFIPFETLLLEETSSMNFKEMSFLLRSTEVSYEISASKYLRSNPKNIQKKTVLGVFPVFENTETELSFSKNESKSIQRYFNGDFIEKEQATYQRFTELAKKHDIIHLSTHAESGNFSRPASIQFRDQNILVNQLYGTQLNADLVVLSACETGVGRLAKGEGPISIGRGFHYAGVENILFSLWKVNDKTTATVMKNFYKNLNHSIPKARAIHRAKLDYLDAENISNAQKSPYYWAAFVYYGEVEHSYSLNYLWYRIGIVLFILIILLLPKFLQNKK
ncbi:tetratricopeptide repeat protein [Aquimarina sp. MAR_2010_214]|uniref:CHAT domain-containing protein n=1 Tax=Aquimarina sp. MAR_2010_214 TaxID=1250026 RepID=UPI000CB55AC1|nr:CHAT domain-containing protein [Aquimarina sp. MAR_2010_214]PKV49359.1 tetratricopeptide repeat protein [Aquimarina sp. MAR_2010_214]